MGSGKQGSGRRRAVPCAIVALLAAGCASIDPSAVLAERESAMLRWSGCVERHAGLGETSVEAIRSTRHACDGHRRDIAHTFAPHLAARVQARLDARERRLVVRERIGRAALAGEPLSAGGRLRERLDRLRVKGAALRGDG